MNKLLNELTNIVRTKIHGEGWEPKVSDGVKYSLNNEVYTYYSGRSFRISRNTNRLSSFYNKLYIQNIETGENEGYIKLLGKPLTLREILLALDKSGFIFEHTPCNGYVIDVVETSDGYIVEIPLTKEPQDYSPETLQALIDLLK